MRQKLKWLRIWLHCRPDLTLMDCSMERSIMEHSMEHSMDDGAFDGAFNGMFDGTRGAGTPRRLSPCRRRRESFRPSLATIICTTIRSSIRISTLFILGASVILCTIVRSIRSKHS